MRQDLLACTAHIFFIHEPVNNFLLMRKDVYNATAYWVDEDEDSFIMVVDDMTGNAPHLTTLSNSQLEK